MNFRIGYGHDLHRLHAVTSPSEGGNKKLVLGGVTVSTDVAPVAHSDGDVVIHALVDAILGALGQGDIGDAFPNTDPRWKGADSVLFLAHALHLARARNCVVTNVDVLILAEKPKLGRFKREIAANLSKLLNSPRNGVNVKAGTNEGCDAIGRGEAIAATVVLLLEERAST